LGKKHDLTVLHDWDDANLYGKRFILKSLFSSICLLAVSILPFLVRFKIFREPHEAYRTEKRRYLDTLSKLDTLTGVTPIFGIRDTVLTEYPNLKTYPNLRIHTHKGEPPDPNRIRTWKPPLNQPQYTWRYDLDYVAGKTVLLKTRDTYPIWHVDNPHHLTHYIDFLYAVLCEGKQIYE